jgi:hypothetical protein
LALCLALTSSGQVGVTGVTDLAGESIALQRRVNVEQLLLFAFSSAQVGVPGVLDLAGESIDPPLCLVKVEQLLPVSSEATERLCLLVRVPVPPISLPPPTASPTSFNCLVMEVKGSLGFKDGFLLMVPVGGKSASNAAGSSTERQPLELELEPRLRALSLRVSERFIGVNCAGGSEGLGREDTEGPIPVAIELREQERAWASWSRSSCAISSTKAR